MNYDYVYVENLIIEVTRMCNLECGHCMRGEREPRILDIKHLENLLPEIHCIGSITLTGGEPALVVHTLIEIRNCLVKHRVEVQNFYLVTNGTMITPAFVLEMINWWCMCTINEGTHIQISRSLWHGNGDIDISMLQALSFFSERGMLMEDELISEGRAVGIAPKEEMVGEYLGATLSEKTLSIDGELYINCLGMFVSGCDYSYENQNKRALMRITESDNIKSLVAILKDRGEYEEYND